MKGFRDKEVYKYVSREESSPGSLRRVDHNKGTCAQREVQRRLVAQEFATDDRRDDLFAATPALAATRLLQADLSCSST